MRLKAGLATRLLPRLRRYCGINVVCVLQQEAGEIPLVPGCRRAPECRVLTEREVLDFAADPALLLDPRWVRDAFARGSICLGAVEEGRLLAYTWLGFCDTPYAGGVWIELGAGMRYSYKSFVRPECRGQRIIQVLRALGDRPELWRGRRAEVNLVDADNRPSLAALRRAGSRTLGHLGYARIFGALITFASPAVRHAGIRLYTPRPRRAAVRMRTWPAPNPGSSA